MNISAALRRWLEDGAIASSLTDPVPDLAHAHLEGEKTSKLVVIGFHERAKLESGGRTKMLIEIDGFILLQG